MNEPGTDGQRGKPREIAVSLLSTIYKAAVSPLLHAGFSGACRFQPSCSEYATIALAQHGLVRGGWLALRRLLRCHPGHPVAFDPVPGHARPSRRPEAGAGGAQSSGCGKSGTQVNGHLT
ncbi:MAG TPA: membrane protein insertion efficiency factor YidD [Acidisarcina sp.]